MNMEKIDLLRIISSRLGWILFILFVYGGIALVGSAA